MATAHDTPPTEQPAPQAPAPARLTTMLQYAIPIFCGAFLLFQIQPIIARCILPWFGGTPAVWTTCMLFFQVLLLGGYAYAHWSATRLSPRAQSVSHGVLLGLSVAVMVAQTHGWGVPLLPDASWKPAGAGAPLAHILLLLLVAVGLPYFMLATTSPLLQSWFSRTRPGVSPYRLYMLSNVGSLLGLLTYPFLIEPALAMRQQAMLWSGIYVLFMAGYLVCVAHFARATRRATASPAGREEPGDVGPDSPADRTAHLEIEVAAPLWRDRLIWVGLPALASTLLLAVTNQICQELAVIPFLWILPLTLYLLTFIICFDNPAWYSRWVYLPAMMLVLPLIGVIMTRPLETSMRLQITAYVVALFVSCMFCHGEVVARRPHPRHLTAFYLCISIGGAIGGLFVGLVAPLLFARFYELHLALAACWIIGLITVYQWRTLPTTLRQAVTLGLVVLTIALPPVYHAKQQTSGRPPVLMASRNFYGIFRVELRNADRPEARVHTLVHGATIHGIQYESEDMRHKPVSYYSPRSGLGLAILNHPRRLAGLPLRIAVLGLGTGNIAIYGQPGDSVRFYEINPAVEKMARDPEYFSYLQDSAGQVEVKLGDARLTLERELREQGSQQFDIIAMDAFSSDSVPAHLLTKEAFAIYLRHLRQPDGVIAVNISNRFLDLRPVVWAAADYYHQDARWFVDPGGDGVYCSHWMLLTRSLPLLTNPAVVMEAEAKPKRLRQLRMWTDDYYNLFQILK